MAYSYQPEKIMEMGKDRMRFELGDTAVAGEADTTALSDEEILAAIEAYPEKWKRAKLMLLESIYHRFCYEVDTKTGPLSLSLSDRSKRWQEEYIALKKEVKAESITVPKIGGSHQKPPYFYAGMMQSERSV